MDRTAFNTQQVNFLKEIYSKEEKYRNEFLDKVDAAERAAGGGTADFEDDLEETPHTGRGGAATSVSSQSRRGCEPRSAEEAIQGEISKNLWRRVNPGYVEPRRDQMVSTGKTAFVYEPDEIEPVSREHFRKRDTFTQYVEASSRYKLLMKAKGADAGPPSPPAAARAPAQPKAADKPASA
ncbi:hypothetical protein KFL_006740050 [Klebsormidium nitens]|uniref:Uncharacterized protein n=1 Tax=Klebsormidium nitens TaxID=105231 RepID=A0A1Y1INE3_KLENI|nr:hypothetical protein KFL_006740050 [Klebsormidium nitens]|eukprot:GAQ90691.1 hypothetical protein KFL_006740050 [Klebsormidium nitens]